MRRPLLALALSLSLYGTASAAPVISTLPGDPTTATGITGLEIPGMPGVVYDVDFTRAGESFNAIFGFGDPPTGLVPTFYSDPTGAFQMADAIAVAFDASSVSVVGDAVYATDFFHVPTRADSPDDPTDVFYSEYGWIGVVRAKAAVSRNASENSNSRTGRCVFGVRRLGGWLTFALG